MGNEPIAIGKVESLCINGEPVRELYFGLEGPRGDAHAGFVRKLSGHDGAYARTSALKKGSEIFNWRSWTALGREELSTIGETLGADIPSGCLLENLIISGIPNFSKLPPTSRLVFPPRDPHAPDIREIRQAVLAVWEENGPCAVVGARLERRHGRPGLRRDFVRAAQGLRGVMGFVLSPGPVAVGDEVLVYPPV